MAMSALNKDLVYLVLQCLEEGGHQFKETLHRLEQESGLYFDLKYFEEKALNGEWIEVERYLSGFTSLHDNGYSMRIYFEIRKEKYLEALDREDVQTAAEILRNDLKVFEEHNNELYKQLTMLITLPNFREHELLCNYGDTRANRVKMVLELKRLIQVNPVFEGKLSFPTITSSRLQSLINQSSNWQDDQHSRTPTQNTETRTLETDHACLPASNLNLVNHPLPPPAPLAQALAPVLALPALPYNINSYIASSSNIANSFPRVAMNQYNAGSSSQGTGIVPQQITEPGQCLVVTLPDHNIIGPANKIGKLMYMHSGNGIWALTTTARHKFWKWEGNATIGNVIPQLWQPVPMRNDALIMEAGVPCLAIAKNDAYFLSACAGNVTLFNLSSFEVMMTFRTHRPAPTFVALHPHENQIKVFGMEDSTINIYHFSLERPEFQLKGHRKRVTGITFSSILKLMVSSGADAQILFWGVDTWERKNSLFLELPGYTEPLQDGDTMVQFHTDQIRILVSHETQLAIYVGSTMTRVLQWIPQGDLPLAPSLTTFSCNGSMIYAAFRNATIGIFDPYLRMICRISPNIYIPRPPERNENEGIVHSIDALAAHPYHPNQFAVGLTDGSVKIIEPKTAGHKWGQY